MTYLQFEKAVKTPIFTFLDILKLFPQESDSLVRVQLYRFARRKLITEVKRGIYIFAESKIDELELAGYLYQPSYISLETALNYYGIIPDIPLGVTLVTPVTTKKFVNQFGHFHFQKIKKELFWGFKFIQSYQMAFPEKALLDYFYIRHKREVAGLRLDLTRINWKVYNKFVRQFPGWIRKIKVYDKFTR